MCVHCIFKIWKNNLGWTHTTVVVQAFIIFCAILPYISKLNHYAVLCYCCRLDSVGVLVALISMQSPDRTIGTRLARGIWCWPVLPVSTTAAISHHVLAPVLLIPATFLLCLLGVIRDVISATILFLVLLEVTENGFILLSAAGYLAKLNTDLYRNGGSGFWDGALGRVTEQPNTPLGVYRCVQGGHWSFFAVISHCLRTYIWRCVALA